VVAGADIVAIVDGYQESISSPPTGRPNSCGDGKAAELVLKHLLGPGAE